MKYILKKAEVSSDGSFIGDGKLTPAKDSKDSWIMKQIIDKQIIPGIKRKRDKEGLLKFSFTTLPMKLEKITDSIFYSFSNVKKNYSVIKDKNSFCVRMAWEVEVFCDDEFLELKDLEYYSKIVCDSAKEDIEYFMVRPIRFEGKYDLPRKSFSVCATAIIPIEFVNYFKSELEKRGF